MDFDSIISVLLIILFFVFPSLLKRLNQKKKTAGSTQVGKAKQPKAKKLSLFEKLGGQIREYIQTLEQEAQKGRQSREAQENIWDRLEEDGDFEQDLEPEVYAGESVVEPSVLAATPVIQEKEVKQPVSKLEKQVPACNPSSTGVFRPRKLSSRHLQQAIIWSEILSKPLALRENTTIN